ncbi:MAG: methyl-accepting chemotaxis protein, partial [Chloroflexi bacterium]|nr:methyl-accepting chemotaxis protein [Chloroflexota bacterium]
MTSQPVRAQRRKYFLREGSQLRLIIGIQIIFFALLVLGGALFFSATKRDLGRTLYSAHIAVQDVSEIVLPTLVGMNILGAAGSIVASILYTHRVAGPAFNLTRALKDIGRGNLRRRVTFRKHDEMKELAEAANDMIADLNARLGSTKESARLVTREAAELSRLLSSAGAPLDSIDAAERLDRAAADLIRSLDHFKL